MVSTHSSHPTQSRPLLHTAAHPLLAVPSFSCADLWYAQFPSNPFSSTAQPTWSLIAQTGGGPAFEPACSCAYWSNDATVNLVMMGYRTQDQLNQATDNTTGLTDTPPTVTVWHGAVTYTPTEQSDPQALPEHTADPTPFPTPQPIETLLGRSKRQQKLRSALERGLAGGRRYRVVGV